jgi:hypothetical protein
MIEEVLARSQQIVDAQNDVVVVAYISCVTQASSSQRQAFNPVIGPLKVRL